MRAIRAPRFEPPLRQRLLWRDPLTSDTLISEDRGLMARSFGTVSLAGASLGCLILLIHADPSRDYQVLRAVLAIELVFSSICFLVYRRLPIWFFHLAMVLGICLICASAAGEAREAAGVLSLCMVFIVLLANLFFTARLALMYTVLAAGALGLVLYARDVDYWQNDAVAGFVILGSAGAVVGWLRGRVERMALQLDRQAKTDAVTGLPNRRGFNQRCDVEFARAAREQTSLSLIVCDLDRFKRVNDQLGHDEGDAALRTAAEAIRDSVRAMDVVGRLGGEEFGIVLPAANKQDAMAVAERVRDGVRRAFEGHQVPVTVSSGVATQSGGGSREVLFSEADGALYEAKRLGRDRSVPAAPAPRRVEVVAVGDPRYSLSASSTK